MDLVERLTRELGVSLTQAEGGAGLLLQFAQRRLDPQDFVCVADTIPAISDIIGKAPRFAHRRRGRLWETLSRWFGGLGGLAELVAPFEELGCDKARILAFSDALVRFFGEKGGEQVEVLLRRALR